MKGCFLLQRNFAYIGHYLALRLKEKHGITEFCGYVSLRSSYEWLQTQSDVTYTKLVLDQDIHEEYKTAALDLDFLRQLETDYGIPHLWPFILVDRVMMSTQLVREYPYDQPLYSYEDMLRILQVKAKAIINLLETERPDFVFQSVVGSTSNFLLYTIAKKMGIKVVMLQPTTVKNRHTFTSEYDTFSEANRLFNETYTEGKNSIAPEYLTAARDFLSEFRSKPQPYWEYMDPKKLPVSRSKQLDFLRPSGVSKIANWIATATYRHFKNRDRFDFDYISPIDYIKDGVKRKVRNLIGANDLYDAFDPTVPFAFYALHYEPEVVLLAQAPGFADQTYAIRQLALALPVGYTLYVKEHPNMVRYRPRSYYKKLKKTPNVKIINPALRSFDIIPKAKLVSTINGTVGWEASFLKKPVVTFGRTFYNTLPFVKNCRAVDDLPYIVKEQVEHFKYDDRAMETFLAAVLATSTEVDILSLWEKEHNNDKRRVGVIPLADDLAKYLGVSNS